MSNQSDRPLAQGTAVVSVVAALTCACAGNALANRPLVAPNAGEPELSARVAALVERVRVLGPAFVRDRPAESSIAQFRNT